MHIVTADYARTVDIGSTELWKAFYLTTVCLLAPYKGDLSKAFSFLENGICEPADAMECAREFNLIRDRLAQFPPNRVIFDARDFSFVPKWAQQISPVITSCGNFFLTADGNDLLFEIVSILTYGAIKGQRVVTEG